MNPSLENGVRPCLALVALIVLAGCSATPVSYRYYVLQPLASKADTVVAGSLGVAPVTVPGWMDRKNLIYSDGHFRLEQLPEDRWGEPLAEAVSRTVTQNLRRQNPGLDVVQGPWLRSVRPDTVIELELLDLALEKDELMLEVSWSLMGKTGQQRTGISLTRLVIVPPIEAVDLVRAFSLLLSDLTRDLQQQILARP